jgi:hypothetical protein
MDNGETFHRFPRDATLLLRKARRINRFDEGLSPFDLHSTLEQMKLVKDDTQSEHKEFVLYVPLTVQLDFSPEVSSIPTDWHSWLCSPVRVLSSPGESVQEVADLALRKLERLPDSQHTIAWSILDTHTQKRAPVMHLQQSVMSTSLMASDRYQLRGTVQQVTVAPTTFSRTMQIFVSARDIAICV